MALNLKNDVIFKAFFARKGNEEFLIDFLEALLKIEIKTIKIEQEVDLGKLAENEKTGRLDLQAILNNGVIVDIEMQVRDRHNIATRSTFYASKKLSMATEKGEEYENIKKIIMVNILNYEFLPFEEYVSDTVTVLRQHREYEVTDEMKMYFIELPKFRRQRPDMNKKINQWLAFIDDRDKELVEMAESKNKVLKKARKEMDYLTGDAEAKRLEYLRDKWERDYKSDMYWERSEGKKEGMKEGKKKAQLEIAKKMLMKGKSIEEIMEITELKPEEIEQFIKNRIVDEAVRREKC